MNGEVACFETEMPIVPWERCQRVVIYRKRVLYRTRKNYQLDLFDPDDGTYEYSAIAMNLDLSARNLWWFLCGRGEHEKILRQMKSHLAFATVPTNHCGATCAWQQIVTLAHNLLTNFQIETGAVKWSRSRKRTALYVLKGPQTLRFEIFNRAGEVVRLAGRTTFQLSKNVPVQETFLGIAGRLARAA